MARHQMKIKTAKYENAKRWIEQELLQYLNKSNKSRVQQLLQTKRGYQKFVSQIMEVVYKVNNSFVTRVDSDSLTEIEAKLKRKGASDTVYVLSPDVPNSWCQMTLSDALEEIDFGDGGIIFCNSDGLIYLVGEYGDKRSILE